MAWRVFAQMVLFAILPWRGMWLSCSRSTEPPGYRQRRKGYVWSGDTYKRPSRPVEYLVCHAGAVKARSQCLHVKGQADGVRVRRVVGGQQDLSLVSARSSELSFRTYAHLG